MRLTIWLKIAAPLAAFCLVGLSLYAQDQQQQSSQQQTGDPLADAARKAREQKKNAPKPKKVITDDDLPSKGQLSYEQQPASGTQQTGSGATQATQEKPQTGASETKEKDDPETVWRKRFRQQREKIAKAEKELDVLQRELDKSQTQYYSDPQKALQQQNTRGDINDTTSKITAKKQELANLKQQLDDMEDQLRKSGGDPGWAR